MPDGCYRARSNVLKVSSIVQYLNDYFRDLFNPCAHSAKPLKFTDSCKCDFLNLNLCCLRVFIRRRTRTLTALSRLCRRQVPSDVTPPPPYAISVFIYLSSIFTPSPIFLERAMSAYLPLRHSGQLALLKRSSYNSVRCACRCHAAFISL
jgi:hypothetical protein